MAASEFYNFLSNFLNLLNAGKSAQLVFECQEGQSRVHLHHTLHPPPPHQQSHHRHHHQSPSRIRRRARRALARVAATADKSLNDVAPKNVNDSEKSSVPAAAEEETVAVNNKEAIENGKLNFDDAKNATVVREIDHKACQVMLASQNQATQVLPSPHLVREAAVQNVPHPVFTFPMFQFKSCQFAKSKLPPFLPSQYITLP